MANDKRGSMTHWNDCWKSGRDHHGCALARLEAEVKRREAAEAFINAVYYKASPEWDKLHDAWQQLVKEAGDEESKAVPLR